MFQNNLLMAAASTADAAFTVDNSCRFSDNDAPFLSQTPGTPDSVRIGTLSIWVKLCKLGLYRVLLGQQHASTGDTGILLAVDDANKIDLDMKTPAGGVIIRRKTTMLLRDPGAWYHIHISWNKNKTGDDSCIVTINGIQQTDYTTNTNSAAQDMGFPNSTKVLNIGEHMSVSGYHYDGYMAQNAFIDGTEVPATSMGEFNNGVWRPVDITGLTYGADGWLLDFADSSDLGNDISGNNNDFASSGLAANDQVVDTPTNNFSIMSNINEVYAYAVTQINGNLDDVGAVSQQGNIFASIQPLNSGKWIVARQPNTVDDDGTQLQLMTEEARFARTENPGAYEECYECYCIATGTAFRRRFDGTFQTNATPTTTMVADDDYFLMAVDLDNLKLWFGIYNTGTGVSDWADSGGTIRTSDEPGLGTNQSYSLVANTNYYIACQSKSAGGGNMDFGAGPGILDTMTLPSGFKLVNTANLPTPAIKDGTENFQTTLYTGNGSTRNIDQTGNSTFQPDLVWLKNRDEITSPPDPGKDDFKLVDAVRGVTKELMCNTDDVESTDANGVTSFDSDGFGLGTGADGYNVNTENFVAWQWLAGGGAGSSNEDGTINTTTTSVNTTAGFSMGTYTGTGSAATIGHGLGVVPKFIIVKERTNDAADWYVYHASMSAAPETDYLVLNETATPVDDATVWNDTAPTSTVFSIGTNDDVNGSSDTYVYYAFAEIAGFSSFGKYEGNNNADGATIFTGFLPAWVAVHNNDLARNWWTVDSTRDTFNPVDEELLLDVNYGEDIGLNDTLLDFLSTGFKMRLAGSGNTANTFLYMAFAKNPFGGSGTTPMTAF